MLKEKYIVVNPDGTKDTTDEYGSWYDAVESIRDTDRAFESAIANGLDEDGIWDETFFETNVSDWIWANAEEILSQFGYKIIVKG